MTFLKWLELSGLGTRNGDILCCAPSSTDDVTLIADTILDLQVMCQTCSRSALFELQPLKSMVIVMNSKIPGEILGYVDTFHLGDHTIPFFDKSAHLGIMRDAHSA